MKESGSETWERLNEILMEIDMYWNDCDELSYIIDELDGMSLEYPSEIDLWWECYELAEYYYIAIGCDR